jgi:hypothetical protein
MTTIAYNIIENACHDAGLDPDETIRVDYSGRAMYGATCLGIVHRDVGELLAFAVALDHGGMELDWLTGARQDSMGLSIITYWPGVSLDDVPDLDDGSDLFEPSPDPNWMND